MEKVKKNASLKWKFKLSNFFFERKCYNNFGKEVKSEQKVTVLVKIGKFGYGFGLIYYSLYYENLVKPITKNESLK